MFADLLKVEFPTIKFVGMQCIFEVCGSSS